MSAPIKVIVVDDELNTRLALERSLIGQGVQCRAVADGREALQALRESDFDVAIIDLCMPQMNGIEMLKTIRNEGLRVVPIIFTGMAHLDKAIESMKLGAFDFLQKPIDINQLMLTVQRANEHSRALRHSDQLNHLVNQADAIFDASPDMILALDLNGRIVQCNRRFAQCVGLHRMALIGHNWNAIMKDHLNWSNDCFDTSPQLESNPRNTIRIFGGHYIHHQSEIAHPNGQVWGTIHVLRDITELERAEFLLRRRLEFEQVVSQVSSHFIGVVNLDDAINATLAKIGSASHADRVFIYQMNKMGDDFCLTHDWHTSDWNQMAGATPAEVTLAPLIEALTHEHEVQIHIAHDGPPAPAETTLCEVARALGLVSLIAFPIFIKHRLHGFLALGRLSSGPRWLEEDLALLRITAGVIRSALERETSEMLQRMLTEAINHTDEGIIITDTQPRIQYVNPAYEKISGYSAEEALGKNPKLVQSGLHSPEFYENLYQTISQGRVWRGRFLNRRKDGTVFEEASTISPVRKPNGEITNYVAVKRDVTDQVRLEARVRMAQKLESIGQLAAGIAHEINTPTQYIGDNVRFLRKSTNVLLGLLHSIITVCEQSEYPPAAPPEVDDTGGNDIQRMVHDSRLDYLAHEIPLAIQQSIEGIEQVTRIVKALREFSYPNDKLSKIPLDLNRALDNTLTVSRNEWKYVAEIERDYDPDLASYFCSPGDLNQAFLNLIVNAAHAIEDKVKSGVFEQGRLTITTRQLPKHAEIRIGDNGIGIPPGLLEKIFDPFFTTKEVGRGTGQGLSITYAAIVEKHKGTIDVESRVGEGTTFVIKLPLLHPSPAPVDPQTPQSTTELSTISGVNR